MLGVAGPIEEVDVARKQTILGVAGAAGGAAIGAPVGGMGLALMGTAIAVPAVVPPLVLGAAGWYVCRRIGKRLDRRDETTL